MREKKMDKSKGAYMNVYLRDVFCEARLESDARVVPVSAESFIQEFGGFEADFEWDSSLNIFTCDFETFDFYEKKIGGC